MTNGIPNNRIAVMTVRGEAWTIDVARATDAFDAADEVVEWLEQNGAWQDMDALCWGDGRFDIDEHGDIVEVGNE
jgi:hypothetical protein